MGVIATGVKLDKAALSALRMGFHGELVERGDPTYEERRKIWNGSIDRYPALIARCTGVADVMAAVKFARGTDLPVAVRSGGHSFPGQSTCDDGIVIDLSPMKGIRIDPEARTVSAQAGVLLGELDQATQAFGLTVDQLLSVDMVTANGELVKASDSENPDLFWGIRGAGGNFGIVTEFTFRLNPVGPTVLAGPIFWPMDESGQVLRFYRDWITDAPDDLTTIVVHRRIPPLPAIPKEFHGKPVVTVMSCYAGPIEEGAKVMRPMREFGSPFLDLCKPKPFVAHQSMLDPSFPPGWWYYFRSADLAELSDGVIDIVASRALQMTSPLTAFPIFQLGGALRRVGEDETAFNGRGAGHTININATTATEKGFDEEREWSRNFWTALKPYQTSVYVNFLMDEGEERIRQAYGPKRYDRLKALKRKYDPDNFFRINQNISPN